MLNGGDQEGALKAFSRIRLEHGRYHFKAQAHIGQILMRRGDLAQAEQCLVTAARNLADPNITYQYAEFLFAQKRFDEAETAYRRVLKMNPAMPDPHTRLGMIHRGRGQPQEALKSFEQALMLDPRAMVARFMLAQVCAGQGDFVRALNQLHMVLHAQPEFAPARFLQADIFQRLGDHRQALVEFDLYLKLNPKDANAYLKLGASFQAIDDAKQAALAFERAHALNPELWNALASAAELREKAHQYQRASDHFKKLMNHVQYGTLAKAALKRMQDAGLLQQSEPLEGDETAGFQVPKSHVQLSPMRPHATSRVIQPQTQPPKRPETISRAQVNRTAPLQDPGTKRLSPRDAPGTSPLLPGVPGGTKPTIETSALDEALRAVGDTLKSTLRSKLRAWLSEDP